MATARPTFEFFSSFGNKKSRRSSAPLPEKEDIFITKSPSFTGPSSVPESLYSLHAELDNLLGENESSDSIIRLNSLDNKTGKYYLSIRRSHWKDASKVNECKRCRKTFHFTTKKHNCRRCGNVFCESCCQYRRRLSPDCVPDPQGNIYRVCFGCADLHCQALGEVRKLTDLFCEQRRNKRMIISNELERIIQGFVKNYDPNSRLKTAVADTFSIMKVPEWQKSTKWLESTEVEWCTKCSSKFSLFNKKHHCRICGSVYCHLCCKSNLLLYYDEEQKAEAKLINVVGCPDKEPPICLYLVICMLCEEDLEEYQVQQYHLPKKERGGSKGDLADVGVVLEKLKVVEKKLEISLPRFQELIEAYVFDGKTNENVSGQNNVEFFAKLQVDLSDMFTQYAVVIQGLKQYDMSTKTQLLIMRNIISLKCEQYKQGMSLFKSLIANLDKALPAKALQQFQSHANMQAINNTYVMTRQLGFETLNLALKYGFEMLLSKTLSEIDHVCCTELKDYVISLGDDWDKHEQVLNQLLKEQLKVKKLISPKTSLAEKDRERYVEHFVINRSCTVVYQVLRALKAKSSETKFMKSKEALQALLNTLSDRKMKQGKYCSS